jgi:hypothetical protein
VKGGQLKQVPAHSLKYELLCLQNIVVANNFAWGVYFLEFSDQRNVVIQFVKLGSHQEASHGNNLIGNWELVLNENV